MINGSVLLFSHHPGTALRYNGDARGRTGTSLFEEATIPLGVSTLISVFLCQFDGVGVLAFR